MSGSGLPSGRHPSKRGDIFYFLKSSLCAAGMSLPQFDESCKYARIRPISAETARRAAFCGTAGFACSSSLCSAGSGSFCPGADFLRSPLVEPFRLLSLLPVCQGDICRTALFRVLLHRPPGHPPPGSPSSGFFPFPGDPKDPQL